MSLVKTWLSVEQDENDKSLADAIRDLNKHLGSAHTHSRISEWRDNRNGRGDRLPRRVRLYMAKIVVRSVLKNAGINVSRVQSRTLNKIADKLC